MKIAITEMNADNIEAALREVNGRAATHTYTTYNEIERIARDAETFIRESAQLSFDEMPGGRVDSYSAKKMPPVYEGVPIGTCVTLVRGNRDWFLTDVFRHEGTGATVYSLMRPLAKTADQKTDTPQRFHRLFATII